MELKEVVAISGVPGLHLVVGRRNTGLIVETIDEKKRRFPTGMHQKVSILEDISMYTLEGDLRLKHVLKSIYEKETKEGLQIPDKKSGNDDLTAFMQEVLPNYDADRVTFGDIRKLTQWYQILKSVLDWDKLGEDESDAEAGDLNDSKETKKSNTSNLVKQTKGAEKKVSVPKSRNVKAPTNTPRKTGGA